MSAHLRSFVAVLALTLIALLITRWLLRGTSLYESFERRRNYWLGATLITFMVPNFYLAMACLGALYYHAARKDPNPVGIYLMFLLAVLPIHRDIQGFGPISQFFAINNTRTLAIAVLLPLAFRLFTAPKVKGPPPSLAPRLIDVAAIMLTGYLVMVYAPQESITMLMRRTVHEVLDFLLPYFVISRFCRDRQRVTDSLGALMVGALLVSQIAIFEHFKGWLLYGTMPEWWGAGDLFMSLYVYRDSSLRAMATAGHPLVLGHLLVVCIGLLGYFRGEFKTRPQLYVAWAILLLALYSTLSRGPWVASAIVLVLMGLFTRRVIRFYAILAGMSTAVAGALLMSPWADKLINFLPFIGKVDIENVEYRQQILDTTFVMIRQNPLFGNVRVLEQLEHLRQGQGIIDLVNVYAEIAMTYGLIGLFLFCVFLFGTVFYSVLACWRVRKKDPQMFSLIGAAVVALLGSMVTLVGIANYLSVPLVYTAVAALLVSSIRLSRQPVPRQADAEPASAREPGRAVAVRPS
ncbi:MAG: O-antigen ligase family protein [Rubrivivax sp.]|nr:O-antigen ligase family protein [Rubrivivax sp.]